MLRLAWTIALAALMVAGTSVWGSAVASPQQAPALDSVVVVHGSTTATGHLVSAAHRTYRIRLYRRSASAPTGWALLGARNVTTGANGRAAIWMRVASVAAGTPLRATATDILTTATSAPGRVRVAVVSLTFQVLSRRPHDDHAFTEGLVIGAGGDLFESTGLTGHSTLREVDPQSGDVLRSKRPPGRPFAEGLAVVGGRLIQLTYKEHKAFVWDATTFQLLGSHLYQGQGWGLCYDGIRLVMSNGSDTLRFRDPQTFAVIGSVQVRLQGKPVEMLNELECVNGKVWANVWRTKRILRIDPTTGDVTGILDASGIISPDPSASDPQAVLNGIAYDRATHTYLLTGKRWPQVIEVRIVRR